ncbi:hypothetical protein BXZ70DRAFT_1012976 [Cristinia sonorae]|uniref:DUF6533 domain-containing protein n=1 Tax=Cristinia sonorae TaxID=1940300 RepID=A0A8K0UE69_9AGAR|nr:hypothetical protein BXZ70DRAFT_1012976 [Cristinia sonorae]
MAATPSDILHIVKADAIPLFACVASFVWVVHDYVVTLEDEIRYIWPYRWNLGKMLYFWIRVYTVVVTLFDVLQIHIFAHIRPSLTLCVAMDPVTRVLGALSLWSIETVMQMRIYALYGRSKKAWP